MADRCELGLNTAVLSSRNGATVGRDSALLLLIDLKPNISVRNSQSCCNVPDVIGATQGGRQHVALRSHLTEEVC